MYEENEYYIKKDGEIIARVCHTDYPINRYNAYPDMTNHNPITLKDIIEIHIIFENKKFEKKFGYDTEEEREFILDEIVKLREAFRYEETIFNILGTEINLDHVLCIDVDNIIYNRRVINND